MILEKVNPGSRLLTDDWCSYRGISCKGHSHDPVRRRSPKEACEQWPLVHRAVSNIKSWLLGTHHNFCRQRLAAYAAEYCWRANRRNMTREDYAKNLCEPFLPDRLLTLACQHRHLTACQVRVVRWAA